MRQPSPSPDDGDVLMFDLYGTLVDPLAIASVLGRYLPLDVAYDVAATWRQKQVEYSFRMTLMRRYRDFAWITGRALDFALLTHGTEMSAAARDQVLEMYDAPDPFPDVVPGLEALAGAGRTLYVLSNGSAEMLQRCLVNSGLAERFTAWISVDDVRAYKPSPQVYEHAARMVGRDIGELRLVSCNPFDIIGGKSAGMRTAWVNRSGGPFDTLGERPDVEVSSIRDLAARLL